MVKTTAEIEGMMCGMCESHIANVIRNNFDVKSVKVSHRKNRALIVSEHPVSEEQLHQVIDPTGYRLISVTNEPYEKKGFRFF